MRYYSWSERHKSLGSAVEDMMVGWRAMESECRVHRSTWDDCSVCSGNIKRLNLTNMEGQEIHFGSAINH